MSPTESTALRAIEGFARQGYDIYCRHMGPADIRVRVPSDIWDRAGLRGTPWNAGAPVVNLKDGHFAWLLPKDQAHFHIMAATGYEAERYATGEPDDE